MVQSFASDNNAGVCPEAWAELQRANAAGHVPSYGDDPWTQRFTERIRALFETDCDAFLVFNGTAANALTLAAMCRPYHGVVCHALSHVATDECGAVGFFSGGASLLTVEGPLGKLTPALMETATKRRTDVHAPRPGAVSITQSTEVGTLYTPAELEAIGAKAKALGLAVHMDGARFANALAALGCQPADITWRAGVHALSFGGTKNGLAVGEAVVLFDRRLAEEFAWRVKQAGQLASKMRLVAAPWLGLLDSGAWLANARHANAMARRLADQLTAHGIRLAYPVEANAVFAEIAPAAQIEVRARGWRFYTFLGATVCRFMCAYDTTPETVDRFAADIIAAVEASGSPDALGEPDVLRPGRR